MYNSSTYDENDEPYKANLLIKKYKIPMKPRDYNYCGYIKVITEFT